MVHLAVDKAACLESQEIAGLSPSLIFKFVSSPENERQLGRIYLKKLGPISMIKSHNTRNTYTHNNNIKKTPRECLKVYTQR